MIRAGLVVGGLLLLAAPAVRAAEAGPVTPGRMALNGYWRGADNRGGPGEDALAKMQPWAKAERAKFQAEEAKGKYVATPVSDCLPSVMPGLGVPGGIAYAIELLVEPRDVAFLFELDHNSRIAHIGRDHPAGLKPSWLGHSVGHWEGDTLVVDTTGFDDRNILARGVPVTSRMHVVQRLKVEGGKLVDEATFDDPGAFTGPFVIVNQFVRSAPFQEYVCAENNGEGGVPTSTGKPTGSDIPKDGGR